MRPRKGKVTRKMMRSVNPQMLIEELAKELKAAKLVEMPGWAVFVKTGSHKERTPQRADWWYIRAASVLRIVALKGPIGTSKLRVRYGGRKNRGMAPDKFREASGKIIRTLLQQLEASRLIKQDARGVHKGRIVTGDGYKLINAVAKKLSAQ